MKTPRQILEEQLAAAERAWDTACDAMNAAEDVASAAARETQRCLDIVDVAECALRHFDEDHHA